MGRQGTGTMTTHRLIGRVVMLLIGSMMNVEVIFPVLMRVRANISCAVLTISILIALPKRIVTHRPSPAS